MAKKRIIDFQTKLKAVKEYINGNKSSVQLAKEFSVHKYTIVTWVKKFNYYGEKGLKPTVSYNRYSNDLKLKAVQKYLEGNDSIDSIALKYGIRSHTQLNTWIMEYNCHKEFKPSHLGGKLIMTKGRKTTLDERVNIVKECLENAKNYSNTAKKFNVSYQQVYSWTSKYQKKGLAGLIDKRGKHHFKSNLSEIEQLNYQNQLLKAENKRLEIENELLKKLEEIERR